MSSVVLLTVGDDVEHCFQGLVRTCNSDFAFRFAQTRSHGRGWKAGAAARGKVVHRTKPYLLSTIQFIRYQNLWIAAQPLLELA